MKLKFLSVCCILVLTGCDNDSSSDHDNNRVDPTTQVSENDINDSVFISALDISLADEAIASIESASFTIEPKVGAYAESIHATYSGDSLVEHLAGNTLTLPIFGLYNNYENQVDVMLTYSDGSYDSFTKPLTTEAYIDPESIFDQLIKKEEISQKLTYSYFMLKTQVHGAFIFDVDGEPRWNVSDIPSALGVVFDDNKIISASYKGDEVYTHSLTGDSSHFTFDYPGYSDVTFHHELEYGRDGLLVTINGTKNGEELANLESIALEVDLDGNVLHEWNFAQIIADYMEANGDDPSNFVRLGKDWFHMNSLIYDESDNTLLVSSRENFVIKVDYDTSEIKWIFGDQTKHWYIDYPSLQELALATDEYKPIGQHALSIVDGDHLMLFNNGTESLNQPSDVSTGDFNSVSLPTKYKLEDNRAEAVWVFDVGIKSKLCSSIYQQNDDSDYLVNYAMSDDTLELIATNEDKEILFDYTLPRVGNCSTSWNAEQLDLSDVQFN